MSLRNALVPLAPTDRGNGNRCAAQRPNADFVAQLIATIAQAPQTRLRRRAEPEAAIAAYRALGQWPTTAPGGTVCRTL